MTTRSAKKARPGGSDKKRRRHDSDEEDDDAGPTGWEALDEAPAAAAAAAAAAAPAAAPPPKPPAGRHAKKRARAEHEAALVAAERRRVAGPARPASAAEFEALVLGAPDCSHSWVRYMARALSLGDADGARALGRRALAAISLREQGERANVWLALLAVEARHGGGPAAAAAALRDALRHADARRVYAAAVDVLEAAGEQYFPLAEDALRAAQRRLGGPDPWLRGVRWALCRGDAAGAAATLARARAALPAAAAPGLAARAALLEFRLGDAERGRSLLEAALAAAPRRLDLWSVYIDAEIAAGDAARTRALLDRATRAALPPRKMKFLFKRALDYERRHGTPAAAEAVKRRAIEFVERALGGGGE